MLLGWGCLSWHKDTNFKANHNNNSKQKLPLLDVCLGTKINKHPLMALSVSFLRLIFTVYCLS